MHHNGNRPGGGRIGFNQRGMAQGVPSGGGVPEVNERGGQRVDGSGSYNAFMPKFQKLVAQRGDGQYYVRGTFTKYNLDFAEDVMNLNRCGLDQISVETVVADHTLPYDLTQEDLPAIFDEYERLPKILIQRRREHRGLNFYP